jgi:hypothetical protein
METIKNYLDNMFAGLPKTARVLELKNNILTNMEEKYNELKHQGKSENEAIGIVISEFGNIDELVSELGILKDTESKNLPLVTETEVNSYLAVKKRMGLLIGIGVSLCILGAALLILFYQFEEQGVLGTKFQGSVAGIPGLVTFFLFITAAVGIFIYSGMNFERYKYMESGVQLSAGLEASLREKYDSHTPKFYMGLITAVCLLIISPMAVIITSYISTGTTDYDEYGVVFLLVIVAFAVFLLISTGTTRESYQRLLKMGDYSIKQKKENKVIGAVASIVWPLAVIIFLFCGFVYGLWHIAWIIFPITGILFGMFSAVFGILTEKND